jgi:GNAT superfamily N-acetyltransferase
MTDLHDPEELSIRCATPSDLDVILRHRERMFLDMGYADDDRLATARSLSAGFFAQGLADGSYRGWLVERADQIVAGGGIVLLRHHASPRDPFERRPVVVNMFTEPEHRRRGLARRLMAVMIEWSRSEGFSSLHVHTSRAGRALYESLGFAPTNEMRLPLKQG